MTTSLPTARAMKDQPPMNDANTSEPWTILRPNETVEQAIGRLRDPHGLEVKGGPKVVIDQDLFGFTFEFDDPMLHLQHEGTTQSMESLGNVVINKISEASARRPFFFLHVSGKCHKDGRPLKLICRCREDDANEIVAETAVHGEDLVVRIRNRMDKRNPVQYFTFAVDAENTAGVVKKYDPICINVPRGTKVAGSTGSRESAHLDALAAVGSGAVRSYWRDPETSPPRTPAEIYEQVQQAADARDPHQVDTVVDHWMSHLLERRNPYPDFDAFACLKLLRNKRYFGAMLRAGEGLIANQCNSPAIRRLYAQALIDTRRLVAARAILDELFAETTAALDDPEHASAARKENFETRGLLGRVYKQLYVSAQAPTSATAAAYLGRAIGLYLDAYREDVEKNTWHGINAVALARLASRERVEVAVNFDTNAVAERILAISKAELHGATDSGNIWAAANGVEASLALNRWSEALEFAKLYVGMSRVDAFEVGGTLRQLEEIWQLGRSKEPQAGALLALLKDHMLSLTGGVVEIEARNREELSGLERAFNGGYVDVPTYEKGLKRIQAIAQVCIGKDSFGTGFLVEGGELHPKWAGQRVFVTNHHVVSQHDHHQAEVRFSYGGPGLPTSFEIAEILWWSPFMDAIGRPRLDTVVAKLGGDTSGLATLPLAPAPFAPPEDTHPSPRVNVIGHPNAGRLVFSLFDNLLLACDDTYLHYRTPTDPGSSGSPVFDLDWNLVGLHHRGKEKMPRLGGGGTYEANEAISIFRIKAAIAAALGS